MSTEIAVKKGDLFDKMKEDAMMSLFEGILPKLEPFMEGGIDKMNEWLGSDEKSLLLKKIGGKAKIIIFNNKVGKYEIITGENPKFIADKECILAIVDVGEFLKKLLSGGLDGILKEA